MALIVLGLISVGYAIFATRVVRTPRGWRIWLYSLVICIATVTLAQVREIVIFPDDSGLTLLLLAPALLAITAVAHLARRRNDDDSVWTAAAATTGFLIGIVGWGMA